MKNKILITGASGFIGENLYKILNKKKNVTITGTSFKNSKKGLIKCNLLHKKQLNDLVKGNDCIIHCAGYTNTSLDVDKIEKKKIWKYNYETSKILIKLAKKNKIKKFIYISSSKVLGEYSKNMIKENMKPKPKTEYAKSKFYSEKFLNKFGKLNKIDVICLRPTLVYGSGCKGNLRNLFKLLKLNLLPEIKKINNKISLIHVEDLCNALIKVIFTRKRGDLFLLSGPKDLSLNEIVSCMRLAKYKKKSLFKLNINFLIKLNYFLKKINFFKSTNKICFFIDKLFSSSFYESRKFNDKYKWKPKIYPSRGFIEMIRGE